MSVNEEVTLHESTVSAQGSGSAGKPTPFDMYRFLFPNRALRRSWVERKWKQFEKAESVQSEQHVRRWGPDLQTRVRNYRRYLDKIIRESYYIKRMCVRYNSRRRKPEANTEGTVEGEVDDETVADVAE